MNRRDALLSTGGMMVSAYVGGMACGTRPAVAQNPGSSKPAAAPAAAAAGHHHHSAGDATLAEAALQCLYHGEVCVAHCIALLAGGDATMAGCATAVNDMRAAMNALAIIAAHGSKNLTEFARAAVKFCVDCEAECKKHEAKHPVCKDCAESCRKTIAVVQKLT